MCLNWIVVGISRDWGIGRGRLDRGRILVLTGTVWFVMATENKKKVRFSIFDKYRRTAQNIALKYHKKHSKIVIFMAIYNAWKL